MNGLSVSGQKAAQNLQIEHLNLKSKIKNCNFYPCPSDTIKHSLECSKPGSFQLKLNALIVQLSNFIR